MIGNGNENRNRHGKKKEDIYMKKGLFFTGRSAHGLKRFLAVVLSVAMALPLFAVTPAVAGMGDLTDTSGLILRDQAYFAFEVESPLGTLKEVPTWDEIEHYLDDPYAFALDNVDTAIYPQGGGPTLNDNVTGRPLVNPATGIFIGAGTGNDQGWPSYRLTQPRRRAVYYRTAGTDGILGTPDDVPCQPGVDNNCTEVLRTFLYRNAAGEPCAPGTAGCAESVAALSRHLVHPLNYNYQGGEELRLLNIDYAGGSFDVPGPLLPEVDADNNVVQVICGTVPDPVTGQPVSDNILRDVYRYQPVNIEVSTGIERLEDDEIVINYNSPIQSDLVKFGDTCVRTVEPVFSPGPTAAGSIVVPEGICLCGGDPGEPGYAGFGVLVGEPSPTQYSTPAVPGATGPAYVLTPNTTTGADLLYDPSRGFIYPRDPVTGYGLVAGVPDNTAGVMRKPSIRIPLEGCIPDGTGFDRCGNGIAPNYLWNSDDALLARAFEEELGEIAVDPENPTPEEIALATEEAAEEYEAFLAPSNENDYIRNRDAASVLGKAIFWDQQLGSDSVQSCGSCHFHAGADNRSKNQLNPNHLSGDLNFEIKGPNQEVEPSDFPFHKLATPDIAGDPACENPVVAPILGQVVCDAANLVSDSNDVMSSMGVFFGNFGDIPTPGASAFSPADNTGVRSLMPDIRSATALNFRQQIEAAVTLGRTDVTALNTGNLDPIPAFQDLRRVEPRNTPTLFGSAMNFDNFWDGRARHDFNGGSVFGPSDPQKHVWVYDNVNQTLVPTRQMIRFSSLASLFTGPALSEFEMSHRGRNWAKVGKKLLQAGVTPLANQLVDPTDSVLGPYSNQGGVACATLPPEDVSGGGNITALGKPGLCISYPGLIRKAYYPALWENDNTQKIVGKVSGCTKPMVLGQRDPSDPQDCDPFDGYVLALDNGAVNPAATNQFTQMEANVPLFFGLAVQAWGGILVPDDTPLDRFFDANPDSFRNFGESGETFLVLDYVNCFGENSSGGVQGCFTEVGNFKRDNATASPILNARINCSNENCTNPGANDIPSHGTRTPTDPDPLMGLDFFLGSNMSLKNPNFRSLRCGECHAGGTLTDHTFEISHQMTFGDWIPEFIQPGLEIFPEPLTRGRLAHPFALEGELQENAQDGIERNVVDKELDEMGFPKGMALLDNGMYNLSIRPIHEDQARGGPDAFGWPLSLSYLAFKNLAGADFTVGGDDPSNNFAQPGDPPNFIRADNTACIPLPGDDDCKDIRASYGNLLPNWDPQQWVLDNNGLIVLDNTGQPIPNLNLQTGLQGHPTGGGLFHPSGQDFQINPGFGEEPADPQLPPHLAKWASNINVGDETQIDEIFVGLNTVTREPILEGFLDTFGPFNPAATVSEMLNNAAQPEMGTWPNANRVNVQGAFKAAPLRHVELTGPYFHNGAKLTLRQQLDFYDRGGDFPISNSAHRDFLLIHFDIEDEALGGWIDPATGLPVPPGTAGGVPEFTEEEKEAIKVSIIDFLLELTDERVAFERAPFDHPEVIIPLDGRAPENVRGRAAMLSDDRYRIVPAVGELGNLGPDGLPGTGDEVRLPNFLNIASGPRCSPFGPINAIGNSIPPCDPAVASHYSADTTTAVAPAKPVKAAATSTTATASTSTVKAAASASPQVLALNTGITFAAPAVSPAIELALDIEAAEGSAATEVTLTAAASGGTGIYQYRFWIHNGAEWTMLQDYGTAAVATWTPSEAGEYVIEVHARNAGSGADYEAWTRSEYIIE